MTSAWKGLVVVLALLAAGPAWAQVDEQQTINRAQAAVERLKTQSVAKDQVRDNFARARAVLVVPDLYKGGFLVGGQFGNGALLVRRADGSFGYPGFYTLAGGSLGLQIGAEDISTVVLILTEKGLNAVLANQFTFGGSADVTVVAMGAGMGASTTTAVGPDILVYALGAIGLYGGLSLQGAALTPHTEWDAAYYGRPVNPRDVVMTNIVSNPQADKLRDTVAQ